MISQPRSRIHLYMHRLIPTQVHDGNEMVGKNEWNDHDELMKKPFQGQTSYSGAGEYHDIQLSGQLLDSCTFQSRIVWKMSI